MAARRRRKTKAKRRSKKQGVSIIGMAETAMLLNVATQTMFNNDLVSFFSGPSSGAAAGTYQMTLRELVGQYGTAGSGRVYGPTATKSGHSQTFAGAIGHNIKKNWVSGAMGMVLIPLGFKVGKKLARPAISRSNRLLNKAGVGSTVKL